MIGSQIYRISRQSFEILVGALIMLHLTPVITSARAALMAPLNEVRVIDRDVIHLSDVFTQVDSSRDRSIGPAPQPGQDVVLNARTLMTLAVAYGVNWQPSSTADQVTLRRDGTVIKVDDIKSAVNQALGERGVSGKYDVAFNTAPNPILLGKGASTELNVTKMDFNPDTSSFDVIVTPVAAPARQIALSGRIERIVSLPVARASLQRGTTIKAGDIDMMSVQQSQIGNDAVLDATSLIGQVARRNIVEGRVIKTSDVEVPLSVKRGDKIMIIYRVGGMELSAAGRAGEDGRSGDQIKVINTASNKALQGTVTGNQQVTVD